MKRILIWSDLHCGHRYGLAHPEECVNTIQKRGWDFVEKGLRLYSPFDFVFNNGDLIEGNAPRNQGIELITSDRLIQCDMAKKILRKLGYLGKNAPKHYFTRGTPAHAGTEEDFENIIANDFQVDKEKNIGNSLVVDIDGVLFHLKHKVGGGGLPHTKATPIMKDVLLEMIGEVVDGNEKCDAYIRSHTHNYVFVKQMGRTAVITPGLQITSNYGEKICNGRTDFGFLVCEVENKKILAWHEWISDKPIKKQEVLKG